MQDTGFSLIFLREEQHLMIPTTSSIVLAQNLYDILFQYAITPEKETKLKAFIQVLEEHIKSKNKVPFSLPVEELNFLEDGLQELKLLNWREVPVTVFQIKSTVNNEEEMESIHSRLENLMTCKLVKANNLLYTFPSTLLRY